MPDHKKIGKLSRTKGHSYEREIANKFKELYPEARRHLEYNKADALKGIDIQNTGPLKIQCKRGRNYAPINKIEEVKEPGIKMLVTRGDRKKDIVCLYLDDFLAILKDIGVAYDEK